MRLVFFTFAIIGIMAISHSVYAQNNNGGSIAQEMEGKMYNNTKDDSVNHQFMLQFEAEEFDNEIALLNAALTQKSATTLDSLKRTGHLAFINMPASKDGKYTSLSYCLCYKHNGENWARVLQNQHANKTFRDLYNAGFFVREECSCAELDYVPSTPLHHAGYYMEAINKLFVNHGPELKEHTWTLEKYKDREHRQNNTSDYALANFRKSFIYHIVTTYGIEP